MISAGVILGTAAILAGRAVTVMPSYGSEMRGGTARVSVIVSQEEEVPCPVVTGADVLLALNAPSAHGLRELLRPRGWLFFNSSLCDGVGAGDDIICVPVPATEEAMRLGDVRVANVILLGAFAEALAVVSLENLKRAIGMRFGPSETALQQNLAAVDVGAVLFRSIRGAVLDGRP